MTDIEPVRAPQSRLDQLMAHSAVSREIVVDQTATVDEIGGRRGLLLEVRLPSYRSLPLACIERIGLKVDGEQFDLAEASLRVENSWHQLSDLPMLLDVWWFILDTAALFVPKVPFPGRHEVAVEIVRVEPYITAGRFSFTNISTASVLVEGFNNA